ncbi:MAG: hypothetical protein H6907_06690 [Hyphomicrobiales bacterium]|nr:hypothetical protein [Hyphomicrobiales bacterium]
MFGKLFSRRKADRPRRATGRAAAPTLGELEEQINAPLRALEAHSGGATAATTEADAVSREALIREALRIQRRKQDVFDGLPPEQRRALRAMAERVMFGGGDDGTDNGSGNPA